MSLSLSPEDRQVAATLLTTLDKRVYGAIDFWTLICLNPSPGSLNPQDFVRKQADLIRSLAVVIHTMVSGNLPKQELSESLVSDSSRLGEIFLELASGRRFTEPEIRKAISELEDTFWRLREEIECLRQMLNSPVHLPDTPERRQYYRGILSNFPAWLLQAGDRAGQPAAVGTSP